MTVIITSWHMSISKEEEEEKKKKGEEEEKEDNSALVRFCPFGVYFTLLLRYLFFFYFF